MEKKKFGFIKKFFLGLLIIVILLICYMYFIEPKILIVQEYAVVNEKIPDSFNGFKIVSFSDIHFGLTVNEDELENVVEKINDLNPDILVFTGDLLDSYINLSENNIEFLKETLAKTNAKLGKYAIKGDSDYVDIDTYVEIMADAGFTILDDENTVIYYKGVTPIYIYGISSTAKEEYTLALETENYQILLAHEPTIFDDEDNTADLVLTGHTLGGIVRLPFLGGIFKLDNTGDYEVGTYEKNGSLMIVSNGVGNQNLGVRLNNTPSINLYRLYNY